MEYMLSFTNIKVHEGGLLETQAHEGIELDEENIEEFHDFIMKKIGRPCGILIDRKNSYSHTFGAMRKIGCLDIIKSIAILVYSEASIKVAEYVKDASEAKNVGIFTSKQEALNWLSSQLEGASHSEPFQSPQELRLHRKHQS